MEQLAFEFARRKPALPPVALEAQTEEKVVQLMAELIAGVYEVRFCNLADAPGPCVSSGQHTVIAEARQPGESAGGVDVVLQGRSTTDTAKVRIYTQKTDQGKGELER